MNELTEPLISHADNKDGEYLISERMADRPHATEVNGYRPLLAADGVKDPVSQCRTTLPAGKIGADLLGKVYDNAHNFNLLPMSSAF